MHSRTWSGIVLTLLSSGAVLAQPISSPSFTVAKAGILQAGFNRHFAQLDRDHDGFLSREEAAGSKWLYKRFDRIDADRDNRLSKNELLAYRGAALRKRKTGGVGKCFATADKEGDRALSKKEAQASELSHVEKRFADIDMNKDGTITLDKFRNT
ncbi:MAG TPA: EF-hand domain-containing protein [Burkholderiaceae bacterium]|jgi:Ca2+-binding EF-hand superfamily protein|nr:EF-hand domain-containing protein [Burkholderiaceae bacterium]